MSPSQRAHLAEYINTRWNKNHYALANTLLHAEISVTAASAPSLPTSPPERSTVFMLEERTAPLNFCSILYPKCVSLIIMLIKHERILILKCGIKVFIATAAQWLDYSYSDPSAHKAVYNLHHRFEEHGTVFDSLETGSSEQQNRRRTKCRFVKQ